MGAAKAQGERPGFLQPPPSLEDACSLTIPGAIVVPPAPQKQAQNGKVLS